VAHPDNNGGEVAIAPSAIACPHRTVEGSQPLGSRGRSFRLHVKPAEAELAEIIKNFADAASATVQDAGFDGVEVHSANGYVLGQFIHQETPTSVPLAATVKQHPHPRR